MFLGMWTTNPFSLILLLQEQHFNCYYLIFLLPRYRRWLKWFNQCFWESSFCILRDTTPMTWQRCTKLMDMQQASLSPLWVWRYSTTSTFTMSKELGWKSALQCVTWSTGRLDFLRTFFWKSRCLFLILRRGQVTVIVPDGSTRIINKYNICITWRFHGNLRFCLFFKCATSLFLSLSRSFFLSLSLSLSLSLLNRVCRYEQ